MTKPFFFYYLSICSLIFLFCYNSFVLPTFFFLDVQARRMPEQERLDDAIGILRNHTEVVCPYFLSFFPSLLVILLETFRTFVYFLFP